MTWNGSGVFQRAQNWVADATAGVKIRADRHDIEDDNFAAGISNCIARDGQSTITANIAFNGKRITGLADPAADQDAVTRKYYQGNSTFTGAVTVSGASPLGRIAFTEADMSWVGKAAAAAGAGPKQRICAVATAAGTSSELVTIDDGGTVNLGFGGLHFNMLLDANNTDFKRVRTGATSVRFAPGATSFFIQVAPAGAVNSVIDMAGTGSEIAVIDINPVGAFGFRPPDGANPAQLNLYGPATGAGANISSGQLNFYSANNLRRAYIWYSETDASFVIHNDIGHMLLGTTANANLLFMTNGATQWTMGPNGSFKNYTTFATTSRMALLYTGAGTEYGFIIGTAAASGVAMQFQSNVSSIVGSINVSASTTGYNTTSDERLKTFTDPYDGDAAIDIIKADPVRTYTWNSDPEAGEQIGWGAQTSYEVDNRLATAPLEDKADDPNQNPWGMDYGRRTPFLWAALARAIEMIEDLQGRVEALETPRMTPQTFEETVNQNVRLMIGDLMLQLAQLRAENEMLKAREVEQPSRANGADRQGEMQSAAQTDR